ncbi:MAG: ribonuclease Y [Deltaproteobacteria bacterium RBG_13_52_11]|nr:MAG: ribonuclease Y [Deltaproteobacteria bacterium RBG_13_52_11]
MQMSVLISIIAFVFASALGFAVGFFIRKKLGESQLGSAEKTAERIIAEVEKKAEMLEKEAQLQAKDTLYQAKADFDKEVADKRAALQRLEKRLLQKEENIDKKVDTLDAKEIEINKKEGTLAEKEKWVVEQDKKYQELVAEEKARLEKIAHITSEEAKKLLMERMENEARHEAAKRIKGIEEELKEQAAKKAKEVISLAVQRYAGEYVMEKTVSLVNLPNEEMKGRIIGREGRNIRALEAATGVDLIIDDTPEAVILSGFNPVRREIARIALERLISDGRIHPARIEEIVVKVEQEVDTSIKEAGEQAAFDVGAHGVHPDLIKMVGKLKYRTSFAQNVYQHSLEVAFLCGIMASELNLNVKQARRAGLLHDIGKAADHEVEGVHATIGADLAKKYGESEEVVNAIAAHHDETDPNNILAVLLQAADALSGARPGARREMLETYVKRLEDLEMIANSFSGVEKSYAIQAGREVRIIVQNEKISDEEALMLSKDIARKIEKELNYPGQIKVTVIRETRAVEYAK